MVEILRYTFGFISSFDIICLPVYIVNSLAAKRGVFSNRIESVDVKTRTAVAIELSSFCLSLTKRVFTNKGAYRTEEHTTRMFLPWAIHNTV